MKTCKVRSRLTVFDVGSVAGRPRSVSSVWSANSFVIDNTLSVEQNTQDNCPSIPSKCYISFTLSNSCHETAFYIFHSALLIACFKGKLVKCFQYKRFSFEKSSKNKKILILHSLLNHFFQLRSLCSVIKENRSFLKHFS